MLIPNTPVRLVVLQTCLKIRCFHAQLPFVFFLFFILFLIFCIYSLYFILFTFYKDSSLICNSPSSQVTYASFTKQSYLIFIPSFFFLFFFNNYSPRNHITTRHLLIALLFWGGGWGMGGEGEGGATVREECTGSLRSATTPIPFPFPS